MAAALEIPWTVTALQLPRGVIDLSDTACMRCQSHLDLIQPDQSKPLDLLATCSACGAWYLVADGVVIDPGRVELLRIAGVAYRVDAALQSPPVPHTPAPQGMPERSESQRQCAASPHDSPSGSISLKASPPFARVPAGQGVSGYQG